MPAVLQTTPYLKYIIHASLKPESIPEDIMYPVIAEFLGECKVPRERFLVYPQLALPWKPNRPEDRREEIPDFAIGNFDFSNAPHFKIRAGAEVKRALRIMLDLPEPLAIEDNELVRIAFHGLFFQAEDQAKSAMKGGSNLIAPMPFFLFVGPYWASIQFKPFTDAQLTVRTHKPSDSGDFIEATRARNRLVSPPARRRLYLLGTDESRVEMERVIATTDQAALPLITAALNFRCAPFFTFAPSWRLTAS